MIHAGNLTDEIATKLINLSPNHLVLFNINKEDHGNQSKTVKSKSKKSKEKSKPEKSE